LKNIQTISGSSAGSIVAVLFALGCDLNIVEDLYYEVRPDLFDRTKMNYFLENLFQDDNIKKIGKHILIPSYNITANCIHFFDNKNDGECKIVDVLLASTAAPYYYNPHEFYFKGKKSKFIDGGVIMNKPIIKQKKWLCIGTGFSTEAVDLNWSITNIPKYFSDLISILIQANEQLVLNSEDVIAYIDMVIPNISINMSIKDMVPYLNNISEKNFIDVNIFDQSNQLPKIEKLKNNFLSKDDYSEKYFNEI